MDFEVVNTVSAALALQENRMMENIGTAVLARAMDTNEEMGDEMVKMMERSVNPGLGENVDVRV